MLIKIQQILIFLNLLEYPNFIDLSRHDGTVTMIDKKNNPRILLIVI